MGCEKDKALGYDGFNFVFVKKKFWNLFEGDILEKNELFLSSEKIS